MLADSRGQLHAVASSSERMRLVELIELQRQDGPCLDCWFIARREEVSEQLQLAFTTRITLEQAKGVVAEAARLNMDQSFALLRGYARHHNLRLSEAARRAVGRELTPEELAVPPAPVGGARTDGQWDHPHQRRPATPGPWAGLHHGLLAAGRGRCYTYPSRGGRHPTESSTVSSLLQTLATQRRALRL